MKRRIVLFAAACAAVLTLCLFLRGDEQVRINRLVLRNTAALEKLALLRTADPLAEIDFSGVSQIKAGFPDGAVTFDCCGRGFGSQTVSYGFYYSPQDAPVALAGASAENASQALTPKGSRWHWAETDGDNWQYTEETADKWYYLEMHY